MDRAAFGSEGQYLIMTYIPSSSYNRQKNILGEVFHQDFIHFKDLQTRFFANFASLNQFFIQGLEPVYIPWYISTKTDSCIKLYVKNV